MSRETHIKSQLQSDLFCLPMSQSNSIMGGPLPHFMPSPPPHWSIDTMPWKLKDHQCNDGVMHFSGNATIHRNQLNHKRKSEIQQTEIPSKQFISEEKITAHFNGLHISSDYIQNSDNSDNSSSNTSLPGKCFTNLTYADYKVTAKELEEKLRNANKITLCEELQQLQDQNRSYIPDALINYMKTPCTAVVLWQPPPPLVSLLKGNDNTNKTLPNTSSAEVLENEISIDDNSNMDDVLDNNNASNLNYNYCKLDEMEEDL